MKFWLYFCISFCYNQFCRMLVLLESLLGVMILTPQWLDQVVELRTRASSPYPTACIFSPNTSVCQNTPITQTKSLLHSCTVASELFLLSQPGYSSFILVALRWEFVLLILWIYVLWSRKPNSVLFLESCALIPLRSQVGICQLFLPITCVLLIP